jgi:hypothetical protein
LWQHNKRLLTSDNRQWHESQRQGVKELIERTSNGMQHNHILVIGIGGTGKSYTAAWLAAQGIPALDADLVPRLAQFLDRNGNIVSFARGADAAWFAHHRFCWHLPTVRQLLNDHATLILFGYADNMFEVVDWFDSVYHLQATDALLLQRLTSPSRENWMGETAEQRGYMLHQKRLLEVEVAKRGILSIDAVLTPAEIYERICAIRQSNQ